LISTHTSLNPIYETVDEHGRRQFKMRRVLRELKPRPRPTPMPAPTPKPLTNGQQIRRAELIQERDGFAPRFREAKKKITEKQSAVGAAIKALEEAEKEVKEAQKEKKDLEARYAQVIAELKPLDG
jgi:hypothetical protein